MQIFLVGLNLSSLADGFDHANPFVIVNKYKSNLQVLKKDVLEVFSTQISIFTDVGHAACH